MKMPGLGVNAKIDQAIINRQGNNVPREYLGASILGEPCDRKLWYMNFDPIEVTDARILRIFEMGHIIEDVVIKYLKESGLTVISRDDSGNQIGFRDGEIAGHCDGVILGLPESGVRHLLEIKSYNYDRFSALKRGGVISSDFNYYIQMVVYMDRIGLERGLFVAYCKDNSEIYCERVTADKVAADMAMNRGKTILNKTTAEDLPREYSHQSFYKCKMCNWRNKCWKIK